MSSHTVRKEEVRAIGKNAQVRVQTFCMGIGPIDFGNASGLGKTIGANPVLAAALARRGFRADDVTSISIYGNSCDAGRAPRITGFADPPGVNLT